MLLARCVDVFVKDLLCVTPSQSEGKLPTLWDAFFEKKTQRSKGAYTPAMFR